MINIHNSPMRTATDTGASCSVFPYELVRGLVPIQNKEIAIVTANGDNMACEGIINIRISLMNNCNNPVCITALVSSELKQEILIGWQDLRTQGVIPSSFPLPIKAAAATAAVNEVTMKQPMEVTAPDKKIENLLDQFKTTVFNEESLPPMKGPPICVNKKHPQYRPMRCLTARRYPVHLEAEAEAEILIFAGHLNTDQGIKPDPAKLGAIKRFPTPKDLTALRSFLGLANQLG